MGSTPHPNPLPQWLATALRVQRPWQLLLTVLIAVVCYLALAPAPPHALDLGWDKLNHAAAFAALTVSGCFGFPGSRRTVLVVLIGLLGFGGLIEILQAFVPGRDCDWHDLLADAVGIAAGATLALGMLRLARQARRPAS